MDVNDGFGVLNLKHWVDLFIRHALGPFSRIGSKS